MPAVELWVCGGLYGKLDFILSYKLTNTFAKVSVIIYLFMSSKSRRLQNEKYMLDPSPIKHLT